MHLWINPRAAGGGGNFLPPCDFATSLWRNHSDVTKSGHGPKPRIFRDFCAKPSGQANESEN